MSLSHAPRLQHGSGVQPGPETVQSESLCGSDHARSSSESGFMMNLNQSPVPGPGPHA